MEIKKSQNNGIVILTISGIIDLVFLQKLDPIFQECLDEKELKVVLDLAGITLISSGGVIMIVNFKKKLEKIDGKVFIAAPSPVFLRVIGLLGLLESFTIFNAVDEAVAAFQTT